MANQLAEIPYEVVHCNAQRMRIRIERLRRDGAYASLLKQLVESLSAVTSVRINSLARSIIIHYDANLASGDTLLKQIASCIQQASLTQAQQQQPSTVQAQQQPSTVGMDNLKVEKNAPSDSNHLDSSLDKVDLRNAPAAKSVSQPDYEPTSSSITPPSDSIPPDSMNVASASLSDVEAKTSPTSSSIAPPSDSTPPDSMNVATASATDARAKTPPTSKTRLKQSALAKRLGVKSQMITRHKQKPEFSTWSMALDPEGKGWSYDSASKTFVEVQPHTTIIEQALANPGKADNQENRDEAVGEFIGKTGGEIVGECVGGLVGDLMLGPVGGALAGEAIAAIGEEIGDALGKKVVDAIEHKWEAAEHATDKPEPNENK